MSGEFTIVNKYLVHDLKKLGLWDQEMLELLKYYDGSVQMIERIPASHTTRNIRRSLKLMRNGSLK